MVKMDNVPVANSANPHCPKFDDLIKFDKEHPFDNVVNSYEDIRKRNVERNKLILKSLGLSLIREEMKIPSKPKTKKGTAKAKPEVAPKILPKRGRSQSQIENTSNEKESQDEATTSNSGPQPQWDGENIFGAIEGVAVGTHWETRLDCCYSGVHRHTVAGIHWGPEGAYSVALSGGYEDDIDIGDSFTYTGEGGRDLKGTKNCPKNLRTAPQSKDQVLERGNLALARSCLSKKPIRVIRGYKLHSEYAPETGYRYDGLYTIKHYWQDIGLSGFKVFKYVFVRCADQAPPPWKTNTDNKPSSNDNEMDLMDSVVNQEAIEVGNKILKMFGEDSPSDNDNNATVLDTTNPSYTDLIGAWPPLAAFSDVDLDAAKSSLPLAQFAPNLDLDNSFHTQILPLSIPEKVTFVHGNSAGEEEATSKQGKEKRTNQTKKRTHNNNNTQHTEDENNNNNVQTNPTANDNGIQRAKKQKTVVAKKDKSDAITLKHGEVVCCRAPENPSNDYYWLAKVHLKKDQQSFSNTRQKIQVQWFEKDPSGREMHYYLSQGFDKIEVGCIYHQGFKLKEVPALALYRLEEDLRKYDS